MRRKWMFVLAPIGIVAFVIVGGEVVMHLWNWLLPALFGWRQVDFWQALGLLVLCRILFGRLGGHRPDRGKWRGWERMTPEEREKFRQGMRSRCGGTAAPVSATKEPA